MKTQTLERTDPPARFGDRVEVHEENIRPWAGTVGAVKWSPVSGWWAEVRSDDADVTWIVAASCLRAKEEER